ATFGVLVMTQDNLKSPWLHFEAGAIAKQVGTPARVAPLLFGLKPSDIHPPLSQFQVTTFDADDVFKLMHSINAAQSSDSNGVVREDTLKRAFRGLWPTLHDSVRPKLEAAKTSGGKVPAKIDEAQVLQEVLVNSRELLKTASIRDREILLEMRELF